MCMCTGLAGAATIQAVGLAAQRHQCSEDLLPPLQECWRRNPQERPSFEQLKARMETIWQAAQQDESLRRGQTGLLSKFRKSKG